MITVSLATTYLFLPLQTAVWVPGKNCIHCVSAVHKGNYVHKLSLQNTGPNNSVRMLDTHITVSMYIKKESALQAASLLYTLPQEMRMRGLNQRKTGEWLRKNDLHVLETTNAYHVDGVL